MHKVLLDFNDTLYKVLIGLGLSYQSMIGALFNKPFKKMLMKREKTVAVLSLIALVAIIMMNVNMVSFDGNEEGMSFGIENAQAHSYPVATDCWNVFDRGSDYQDYVCSIEVSGSTFECRTVNDLDFDSLQQLSTCGGVTQQ